jgi:hypothetical protein
LRHPVEYVPQVSRLGGLLQLASLVLVESLMGCTLQHLACKASKQRHPTPAMGCVHHSSGESSPVRYLAGVKARIREGLCLQLYRCPQGHQCWHSTLQCHAMQCSLGLVIIMLPIKL